MGTIIEAYEKEQKLHEDPNIADAMSAYAALQEADSKFRIYDRRFKMIERRMATLEALLPQPVTSKDAPVTARAKALCRLNSSTQSDRGWENFVPHARQELAGPPPTTPCPLPAEGIESYEDIKARAKQRWWYWDGAEPEEAYAGMDEIWPDAAAREKLKAEGNWFKTKEKAEAYGAEQPKDCNPERDGFWYWSATKGKAIKAESPLHFYGDDSRELHKYLISVGNFFATREEAEDEGKWRYETKLVLDQALRNYCREDNLDFEKLVFYMKECFYKHGDLRLYCDRAQQALGDNAKRYLTGKK